MTHILTLVASSPDKPLLKSHIKEAVKTLGFYNIENLNAPMWLSKDKALDQAISRALSGSALSHLREIMDEEKIDIFVTRAKNRRKKLLLADMDSTIVEGETLDDLAEFAGIKDQIAAITIRAMEGELDFHEALHERVGLLKGLEEHSLKETLEKLTLNPGAEILVGTMSKHGARCVLVSGGFTFFTGAVARRVGFAHHHGNVLGIEEGRLNGQVQDPILDKHAKVDFLKHYMDKHALEADLSMTIGDGANDIPMLKMAGLGVGYQPKQAVAEAVPNLIIHGDLSTALYAQGYKDKDFLT